MNEQDLQLWHDELNASCFDGVLPPVTFAIAPMRGADAPKCKYMGCYSSDSIGRGTIFIHPDYLAEAKAILAHEMIHQWQDLIGNRLDHCSLFQAWAERIESITGIKP